MQATTINREEVYKRIYRNEYSGFCQYAYAYLQDDHAAEDTVQQSIISTWEKRPDLISYEDIRYFLVAVIRNNCITALRKQGSNAPVLMDELPDPAETGENVVQAEEQYAEQVRKVKAAIGQLPPKCREVFLLVKLQGMSYRQAADTLDISVKTVENQMGKALKMIRELAAAVLMMAAAKYFSSL